MTKRTLIVMRHAKTEEQQSGQKDYDRNLLERGRNDALAMARILKENGFKPDVIIASSAKRTMETAEIVAKALNYRSDKIHSLQRLYLSDSITIKEELEYLDDDVKSCCIIGHNPGISEFVYDCNPSAIIIQMPTAAIAIFTFEVKNWQAFSTAKKNLVLYEYPKK